MRREKFANFFPSKSLYRVFVQRSNPTWNISTLYLWNVHDLHLMPASNIDKLPNTLFLSKPFKSLKIYFFRIQLAPFYFKLRYSFCFVLGFDFFECASLNKRMAAGSICLCVGLFILKICDWAVGRVDGAFHHTFCMVRRILCIWDLRLEVQANIYWLIG